MAKAHGAAGVRQFATKTQGTDNVQRSCPYPCMGPDPSLGPWTGPNSGPFQVAPEDKGGFCCMVTGDMAYRSNGTYG